MCFQVAFSLQGIIIFIFMYLFLCFKVNYLTQGMYLFIFIIFRWQFLTIGHILRIYFNIFGDFFHLGINISRCMKPKGGSIPGRRPAHLWEGIPRHLRSKWRRNVSNNFRKILFKGTNLGIFRNIIFRCFLNYINFIAIYALINPKQLR